MPDDAKGPSMPTEPLLSANDAEPLPSTPSLGANRQVAALAARRNEPNVSLSPHPARGDALGGGDTSTPAEAASDLAVPQRKPREQLSEEERAAVRAARRQQVLGSFVDPSAPGGVP